MTTNYKPKQAFTFAYDAHLGQTRRDEVTPYYFHLMAVAKRFKHGSVAWQVAMLHDVLEDTNKTQADLFNFGVPFEVVDAVIVLTKQPHQSYAEFIHGIILRGNITAIRVKFADILANLSDSPTAGQVKKYSNALNMLADTIDLIKNNGQKLFDK